MRDLRVVVHDPLAGILPIVAELLGRVPTPKAEAEPEPEPEPAE